MIKEMLRIHATKPMINNGSHARFRQHEQQQGQQLNLPFLALQTALQEIRPFLAVISKGKLKTANRPDHIPKWLNLPSYLINSSKQSVTPVLAAATTEETSPVTEKLSPKESLRLLDDMLLEIWVEGENLEFFCRHERGVEVQGLEIAYTDQQGSEQRVLTDEFGTAFIHISQLSQQEPTLIELHWQSKCWTYPCLISSL